MSHITEALQARGWAFDAQGTLQPPNPSPKLVAWDDRVGSRVRFPDGEQLGGHVFIRDVNGQVIDSYWVG